MSVLERRLTLTTGGEVTVHFLEPTQAVEDWQCDYVIKWPNRERRFHASGVDAVQALKHAMCNAHADLLSSPEGKADTLRWLGQRELGLPLAGNLKAADFK